MQDEITLPEAAQRCGLTWPAAHKRLLRGDFGPARQIGGRWFVTIAGVDRYLQRTTQTGIPNVS